ncbi:MAG: 16S rRNA (adenine(1518)-N(6)/adenine(1519)-N(6))-dimethyltransferase RsmA [Endomicrobium sp.]|jgi:16S rRNA (adenine1518-N6/adenine1519-N6)-dimethyltransferase|nr:16S rRNA (adenine(1518)-N(6)/adenine(1519)-N(6))-dimethyltransferase RsmA [Endomicrobium sp.]
MRQKHGQNFLIDNNIVNKIIKAANLSKQDDVLEIGPGKGILTKIIQPQVRHLIAVEIDGVLCQQLGRCSSFRGVQNFELINADFFKYNMLVGTFKIISNLPYNVGTAIIQKILPLKNWTSAVFMLQKEVAQRLVAGCGSKRYGYMSIFTSYYADCAILFDVSSKCFAPSPKIVSSVVKLTNKFSSQPESIFFDFIKHSFNMRRKTVLNCISSFQNLEKIQARQVVDNLKLNPLLRPDKLSVLDFLRLTNEIKNMQLDMCKTLW